MPGSTTTSTTIACAPLPDTDNDGVGDACDPCTGGVAVSSGKVTIRGLDTPDPDDTLKFKGLMQLPAPFNPPLDPLTKGVRILLNDGTGALLLDANIPGGAFDGILGRGWILSSSGTVWKYKHVGKDAPLISGIKKVVIRNFSVRVPGLLKFVVVGKHGSLPVTSIPVRATLVIDAPVAASGQCGDATFPGPSPTPVCIMPIPALLLCK